MLTLKLKLSSPEKSLAFENCQLVNFQASSGAMGVMAGHESFLTNNVAGKIEIFDNENKCHKFFVAAGTAWVVNDNGHSNLTIISDLFESIRDFDEENLKLLIKDLDSAINSEPDDNKLIILKKHLQNANIKLNILMNEE